MRPLLNIMSESLLDDPVQLVLGAEVLLYRNHPSVQCFDLANGLGQVFLDRHRVVNAGDLVCNVEDHDISALSGECDGVGAALPSRTSGIMTTFPLTSSYHLLYNRT